VALGCAGSSPVLGTTKTCKSIVYRFFYVCVDGRVDGKIIIGMKGKI